MRVLVTGGAGFIGSHIVERLLEQGHDVSVIDNLSTGREENLPRGVRLYRIDVTSPDIGEVFAKEKPECVVHQAAQVDVRKSVADPALDASVNVLGSINLLEHCRRAGVRKVVYASTAAVYGNPRTVPVPEDHPIQPASGYGISKYTVEQYLEVYRQLYQLDYTILRYANVYGPRQDPFGEGGVVAIFAHRIARRQPVTVFGDGQQTRDFVYAGDVAEANLLALDGGSGGVFNISTGAEVSVSRLIALFEGLTGHKAEVRHAPERPGEIQRSALDNRRAREVLGWSPRVSLDAGLEKLLAYEMSRL
ncbi:MAG: UDP-glucose 4-epimerase [Firmicutes bacterium]|nr:UDP-glucose 4-epimerase [Bacillota bacterium]